MIFDRFVIEKVDSQKLNDKLQSWQAHQKIGNLILTRLYRYASLLGPPGTLEKSCFSAVQPPLPATGRAFPQRTWNRPGTSGIDQEQVE